MRNKILIIVTIIIVILAIVILIWKNSDNEAETSATNSNETTNISSSEISDNTSNETSNNNSSETSSKTVEATLDSNGDIIINSEDLDTSNATFIKYEYDDVSIELIAIKDEEENVKVSFNTCSVCNGSPKAYFTQKNGKLVCQNCKNKFSMSSIGEEGNGCYPICLDDSYITVTDIGIAISSSYLQSNTDLFENIAEFTPEETGTFNYSCWMGMITNYITVVE